MAYRQDNNLSFLSSMKSSDLNDLVNCLTHDKDGSVRFTEELTSSKEYKMYYPDHRMYWQSIAAEIQCFGANSVMTIFRGGKGVEYKEVLMDVCDKMGVNYNKNSTISGIEINMLTKILSDAVNKMNPEELRSFATAAGVDNTYNLTPQAAMAAFQTIFRMGGFKSYQLTVIVVNAVLKAMIGKGLTFAGNAAVTKAVGFLTGPVGWVITGLWTAIDLAGAAYRVTIPAVIHIAVLRQKYLNGDS